MISLIVKSGLGNQLFQYAYARYLQESYFKAGYIERLIINPYYVDYKDIKGNDKRSMSLQHFVLNKNIKILEKKKEQQRDYIYFRIKTLLATGLVDLYYWILRKRKPLGEKKFIKRSINGVYYTFSPYTSFKNILSTKKNKYIFGFFQDERNFHEISDIIKSELLVKTEPNDENRQMIKLLNETNSICLHVRRGDYLNEKWKCLQICDFEYYNKSINYILNHVENPVFYIFSNTHEDLQWIKDNYKFKDLSGNRKINIKYVDLNNPDYEELRLMYNCKHFIISNSTFSWWGAYLSRNKEKIVLAPKRWNLKSNNDSDIYIKEWIKIN